MCRNAGVGEGLHAARIGIARQQRKMKTVLEFGGFSAGEPMALNESLPDVLRLIKRQKAVSQGAHFWILSTKEQDRIA